MTCCCWRRRVNSRKPASKIASRPLTARLRSVALAVQLVEVGAGPEALLEIRRPRGWRDRTRRFLRKMMNQLSTEAATSSSMTICTGRLACQDQLAGSSVPVAAAATASAAGSAGQGGDRCGQGDQGERHRSTPSVLVRQQPRGHRARPECRWRSRRRHRTSARTRHSSAAAEFLRDQETGPAALAEQRTVTDSRSSSRAGLRKSMRISRTTEHQVVFVA